MLKFKELCLVLSQQHAFSFYQTVRAAVSKPRIRPTPQPFSTRAGRVGRPPASDALEATAWRAVLTLVPTMQRLARARCSRLCLCAVLLRNLTSAALATVQVQNRLTPAFLTGFYETPCSVSGGSQANYMNGPYRSLDGDKASILHSNTYSLNQFVRYDLIEERALTLVRLWPRQDCCASRDDTVRIWIGNAANDPQAAGNAQCSFPAGFASTTSSRDFVCTGLFGRYVFASQLCATAGCIINYAGETSDLLPKPSR